MEDEGEPDGLRMPRPRAGRQAGLDPAAWLAAEADQAAALARAALALGRLDGALASLAEGLHAGARTRLALEEAAAMLWAAGTPLAPEDLGRDLLDAPGGVDPERLRRGRWALRRLQGGARRRICARSSGCGGSRRQVAPTCRARPAPPSTRRQQSSARGWRRCGRPARSPAPDSAWRSGALPISRPRTSWSSRPAGPPGSRRRSAARSASPRSGRGAAPSGARAGRLWTGSAAGMIRSGRGPRRPLRGCNASSPGRRGRRRRPPGSRAAIRPGSSPRWPRSR